MWNERGSRIVLWRKHTHHMMSIYVNRLLLLRALLSWTVGGDGGFAKTNIILMRGNSGFVRRSSTTLLHGSLFLKQFCLPDYSSVSYRFSMTNAAF